MYKNIIFDMSEVIITGIHGVEKDIESNFGILADEYEKRRLEVCIISFVPAIGLPK